MFCSPEYGKKFTEVIEKNRKNKREYGFEVLKDFTTNELFYGTVVEGATDEEVQIYKSTERLKARLALDRIVHPFTSLHIHPYIPSEGIVPSVYGGDLEASNARRILSNVKLADDWTIPSIDLIVSNGPRETSILIYREPLNHNPFSLQESMRQLDEAANTDRDQVETLQLLKDLGYQANIIKGKGNSIFTENIRTLESFAYKPVKLSKS